MHEVMIAGYPRSGNIYLSYALQLIYYPDKPWNLPRHTVSSIENNSKVIVPFRNPLDCISSWHSFFSKESIKSHIDFYIRFNTAVIKNMNKITLMDFDLFINDLNYIKYILSKNFGVTPVTEATDYEIKSVMIEKEKEINLPRNNKEELAQIKEQLQSTPGFDNCLELYAQLKG